MKILIISPTILKERSGRFDFLSQVFRKFGHEVYLIPKDQWKKFYFAYLKFKPDVLISVGVIAVLPTILKKMKLIPTVHVHDWNDDYTDVMGSKYGIDRIAFMEHYIIKNADYITTPSKFLQRKCEIFGKTAFYIPHGVDPKIDNTKPIKLDGDIKIVYAGSQSRYKMVDKLVEAVRGLNCELYLIGKSNPELRKIASVNVHFVGLVKHEKVFSYFKAADILVITSDDDSTLKMFEYIRIGKPILALKGRVGYLLDNYVNALLVDDLKEGIKLLLENKKMRTTLSKNVKKIKTCTWEEIGIKYLELLGRVT